MSVLDTLHICVMSLLDTSPKNQRDHNFISCAPQKTLNQIICLVDSSFHFDSVGLSYDLHNQTIVTRLVNWFVHIHTHQLSQTMKLFNPFTATFAAMCPNSISNSELFFEIALAIQPT